MKFINGYYSFLNETQALVQNMKKKLQTQKYFFKNSNSLTKT